MRRLARLALALAALALAGPSGAQYGGARASSYEGLWWNAPAASESGWGLHISHQGDILFAAWFTYDTDGTPLWLVMPDARLVAQEAEPDPYGGPGMAPRGGFEYEGPVYRVTGPAFHAAAWDAALVKPVPVGTANLRFTDPDFGMFTWQVDGASGARRITRQLFGPKPACGFDGAAGAEPNFQALWWRSPAGSESGWGLGISHQGDTLFAAWYTFDAQGRPLWLVAPDARRSGALEYSGTLYRTRGPAFSRIPWDPNEVKVDPVGNATFTFQDAANGTFSYTVDGVPGARPITRQVFSAPVSLCR